jgi:hypothetical protein
MTEAGKNPASVIYFFKLYVLHASHAAFYNLASRKEQTSSKRVSLKPTSL